MNGKAALKLFERMQNTQSGWGQKDFEHLLEGFDFDYRDGKKHRIYSHKKFTELTISVPRHNTLKEWVARDAVKLIEELFKKLERGDNASNIKNP